MNALNIKNELAKIYRAQDCCDVRDCEMAMANIYDLVRRNKMQYTPAIQKRIAALYSAQVRLGKAGKI